MLKLKSAEPGMDTLCIPHIMIECFFDVDEDNKEAIEEYIEGHQLELMSWSSRALKIIKRSKTEEARDLLEEFKDIYVDFMKTAEDFKKHPKQYTVIKTQSQTHYKVRETLDEIEELIEEEKTNHNLGI